MCGYEKKNYETHFYNIYCKSSGDKLSWWYMSRFSTHALWQDEGSTLPWVDTVSRVRDVVRVALVFFHSGRFSRKFRLVFRNRENRVEFLVKCMWQILWSVFTSSHTKWRLKNKVSIKKKSALEKKSLARPPKFHFPRLLSSTCFNTRIHLCEEWGGRRRKLKLIWNSSSCIVLLIFDIINHSSCIS